MNGMPAKQMRRYAAVPSTAASGVDMTATMGRTASSSAAVSTAERARNSTAVLPTQAEARRRSPAPTACAMFTVEPMASPTIITVSMCMTCDPTDTAVVSATAPNWPMMNRSAMP